MQNYTINDYLDHYNQMKRQSQNFLDENKNKNKKKSFIKLYKEKKIDF